MPRLAPLSGPFGLWTRARRLQVGRIAPWRRPTTAVSRLQLTWTTPSDTGGDVTGYREERSPDETPRVWAVIQAVTGSAAASWGAASVTAAFVAYLPGRLYDLAAQVPGSEAMSGKVGGNTSLSGHLRRVQRHQRKCGGRFRGRCGGGIASGLGGRVRTGSHQWPHRGPGVTYARQLKGGASSSTTVRSRAPTASGMCRWPACTTGLPSSRTSGRPCAWTSAPCPHHPTRPPPPLNCPRHAGSHAGRYILILIFKSSGVIGSASGVCPQWIPFGNGGPWRVLAEKGGQPQASVSPFYPVP